MVRTAVLTAVFENLVQTIVLFPRNRENPKSFALWQEGQSSPGLVLSFRGGLSWVVAAQCALISNFLEPLSLSLLPSG